MREKFRGEEEGIDVILIRDFIYLILQTRVVVQTEEEYRREKGALLVSFPFFLSFFFFGIARVTRWLAAR